MKVSDFLEAGIGSRVKITRGRDGREGTVIAWRFREKCRVSLRIALEFADGTVQDYWRPKDVKLVKKASIHVEWNTGRLWRVYGKHLEKETFCGTILKAEKISGYDDAGEPIWNAKGYEIRLADEEGDCEESFPSFLKALHALLGKADAAAT